MRISLYKTLITSDSPPCIWINIFIFLLAALFSPDIESHGGEVVSYQVEFRGIKNNELLAQIRNLSRTLEMAARPAGSLNILRKRVKEDMDNFERLLKSEGYFKAEISEKIDTGKSPWSVFFDFSLNRRFILESVEVAFSHDTYVNIKLPDITQTGIVSGQGYRSKTILEAEERLLLLFRKQGFSDPVLEKREITADHATESVRVHFTFDPGQKTFFGKTEFRGLHSINRKFLMSLIPWNEGDLYDPELLTIFYSDLMNLGLFSTVRITEKKDISGRNLIVEIEVNERKHNSVSAGVNYHTDEGPGLKFLWEKRNLFHNGERLGISLNLSNYITTAESTFKKPSFLKKDQTLRFLVQKSHEDPDAYKSDSFSGSVFIDRDLTEKLDVTYGLTYRSSEIDQLGVINSYSQISIPLHMSLDYSDDLLDPARGGRLGIRLIPFYELSGESLFFTKGLINYRHYLKFTDNPFSVLAGSITLGMIKGSSNHEIPANERFYAGGGGSVRGYPYQSIGPLSGTTPLGGKSILELSVESRWRINDLFGLVLFMDGGSAFSERPFGHGEEIRWGTGVGVRYFTPIGPLRLDIGFPLDKREGIDNSFQIYISIGQAF